MKKGYEEYVMYMQKLADVKYAAAVLQWDQETYMPVKGAAMRGRQLGTLSGIAHDMATAPDLQSLVADLLANDAIMGEEKLNLQRTSEDLERNKKIPSSFVEKQTMIIHESFHAWIAARKQNDFSVLQVSLQKSIELKREEASMLGYVKHPYDALMNDYDRGLTVEKMDEVFKDLIPQLKPLLEHCKNNSGEKNILLQQHFLKDTQWAMGLEFLKKIHYDFDAGRQDVSEHPFTTNFSAEDVRVTTRVVENDFAQMLWSCLHEGGHALYEQGLPATKYGLPAGEYCSLSIHESQSRLWENCIGRSEVFWKYNFDIVKKYFPDQFASTTYPEFLKCINKVEPSLIRTEADELTYHFHVLIRYEIEKAIIEGSLQAKDIPAAWNELYKKHLDVIVPDDKQGCLQDVHWSHGSFGYFATYSLGSLYAAQLWHTMLEQVDLKKSFEQQGNTSPIWHWLQENIYKYGRLHTSEELCVKASGEALNATHFITYAKAKFCS